MCKVSPCASAGQADFPLFHVVLVDAKGGEHGYIGYSFHAPGAQAAANGWNAQPERELTAVIRDGLPPVVNQAQESTHYGVLITHESGKVALLGLTYASAAKAESKAADWHTETTRAVSVDLGRFDDFAITVIPAGSEPQHFELEYQEAEERDAAELASSNALDALSEQDDSDAEGSDENAAESNVVDEICERRAKFVQRELRRHLKRIWNAVPHVTDGADLGIVAASLESVARAVDGVPEDEITHERFAYALHGDMRYTELEEALGVVR